MELILKIHDTEMTIKTIGDDVCLGEMYSMFNALLIGATFHQSTIDKYIIEKARELEEATKQATEYFSETYGSKGSDEYPEIEGTMAICNDIISSQTEISDEEIEKILFHHSNEYGYGFRDAIKWYREQLKSR